MKILKNNLSSENTLIHSKSITQWCETHPLLVNIIDLKPVFWENTGLEDTQQSLDKLSITQEQLDESSQRLDRFSSFLSKVFSEIKEHGIIESELIKVSSLQDKLQQYFNMSLLGNLYLKCDHQLPISGSIKARGGFYEVLKFAEEIALAKGLISINDDYSKLENDECQELFSKYSIVVGSTGNLGLSIGIMSKKIGFEVTVHMSSDAKQWKKDKLRDIGVTVVEHEGDYETAVTAGRETAKGNKYCHFIDDENSIDLFMGYAVAALRLEKQLQDQNITVDELHPLFVYLPCGVGGAPGGICWGLKTVFKNNLHCFFAEPTHSPAMLLGLYTGLHDNISVRDFGIDNITQADGLAVGRPSGFVGKNLEHLINGCYTLSDDSMFELLALCYQSQNLTLEPSAAAGIQGIKNVLSEKDYLQRNNLNDKLDDITHIAWTTGGNMVPKKQMDEFIAYGEDLLLN